MRLKQMYLLVQYNITCINSTITKFIKHKNVKLKQWITNGLVNYINKRNNLFAKLKKNADNAILKEEYSNYKRHLDKLIRKRKEDFYMSSINKTKNKSLEYSKFNN